MAKQRHIAKNIDGGGDQSDHDNNDSDTVAAADKICERPDKTDRPLKTR